MGVVMILQGKTALVTGAGRGIGKGIAIELARRGADLVINDRPDGQDLAGTLEEIRDLCPSTTAIEANVFQRADCERLVSAAVEAKGRIDILVSNPANILWCEYLKFDPDDFERVIAGTLIGGFHISQLVSRHMVERGGGGKILFISSVHAAMPYTPCVAYNAAKSGLNHMARTIALELAPHHINVNCIEPGWIDTPGEQETFGEERLREEGAKLPWGRLGKPSDIGKAAAFLVSDEAEYVTAEVLRVDGAFVFKDAKEEV